MTGEDVKKIRVINDLSQEEFGKRIGLSKSGVSNIENGQRKVTKKVEKMIDIIFGKDKTLILADMPLDEFLRKIPTKRLLEELERRVK